jgi:hypothetical protein
MSIQKNLLDKDTNVLLLDSNVHRWVNMFHRSGRNTSNVLDNNADQTFPTDRHINEDQSKKNPMNNYM